MEVFVAGVDRACGPHAVCIVDAKGQVVDRFEAGHDREGLAALVGRFRRHGAVPVAVERPTGLLVDNLVEAGLTVVPIHPDAVKACRPRYRAASAKSDPGDACILADVLRTPPAPAGAGPGGTDRALLAPDGHRLRPLKPQSDAIKALRALVRGRDDLIAARRALANQLTALLDAFRPGAAAIFADVASPIALAFLERYPTPDSAARLGPKRLAGFLAQHRCCGRHSPETLLGRLQAAPLGQAGEAEREAIAPRRSVCAAGGGEATAGGGVVRALARTLQSLVDQLGQLTRRIEHAVAELPDGRLLMSFPRAGKICAAQILAELGDVRERFPTNDLWRAWTDHRP